MIAVVKIIKNTFTVLVIFFLKSLFHFNSNKELEKMCIDFSNESTFNVPAFAFVKKTGEFFLCQKEK